VKKTIAILLVAIGAIAMSWPLLPQEWGLWKFMGWLFNASDSPSMGIQYMFFWMATCLCGLFAVSIGSAMLAKQTPQPTLTAEEREAIHRAEARLRTAYVPDDATAATLRRLLERLA
jgi:hypothetical protein